MRVVGCETRRQEIEHRDPWGNPALAWIEVVSTIEAVLACGHRLEIAPGYVPGELVCVEGCDASVPPPAWEDV